MAEYGFLSTWLVDAPIGEVWAVIHAIERWPEWWRGVESVTKVRDRVYDHVWRSRVPYPVFRVEVAVIDRPHLIVARAQGELAGTGVWRLYAGSGTAATYEWNVRTTRAWMNALAPVARPVFEWNHHVVMRWGGEGLARHLGSRLLAQG